MDKNKSKNFNPFTKLLFSQIFFLHENQIYKVFSNYSYFYEVVHD